VGVTTTAHAKPPPPPKPEPKPKEQPKEKQPENDTISRAGDLYTAGTLKKLTKQPNEALALFRQSAGLGDARAMTEIGRFYLAGEVVGKDINEAVSWFRKASDAGNTSGMVFLAAMYAQGSGVPKKDDKEAFRLLRRAADGSDPFGMDGVGLAYLNGRGVPQDDAEAVRWFQKAADANSAAGMIHLATMYEKGSGIAKDPHKVIELYQKAAKLGSKEAQTRLAQLEKQQPGGSPQPARPRVTVKVEGNQAWTETPIDVNVGDTVHIGAAGSIVLSADRRVPKQSPDGHPPNCDAAAAAYGQTSAPFPAAPQLPCWSLIGRIGPTGPIFPVGRTHVVKAAAAGRLYFGINDSAVQGNSGFWTALVVVQPAAPH
jgi:TPR repeat protein